MKYDPTAQYLPPQKYRCPQKVVHEWIHFYRRTDADGMPTLKWLMCKSGLSLGTVQTYRANFFSAYEKRSVNTESDRHNPC